LIAVLATVSNLSLHAAMNFEAFGAFVLSAMNTEDLVSPGD